VWPALRARHPELRLKIVGSDPTIAVRDIADEHIEVVGRVPDPSWWLSRARLHLAPMRFGAGLKLKFVESMAAGLPFLTTPLGAEGLWLRGLTAYLVSTSPAEMTEQADKLLTDRSLWTDVQEQLIDIVREHFSTEAFERAVDEALLSCGLAPALR
jgi:glycosyltransferase involved in cell wall biosynthesis